MRITLVVLAYLAAAALVTWVIWVTASSLRKAHRALLQASWDAHCNLALAIVTEARP
jgi:hypothetical protein